MLQKIIYSLILIFFLGFNQIQAQRPPCNPDYISLSYAGKIPARFPLLKLDMPYETMLYYIWWNDWCHTYEDLETLDYFKNKNFDDEFKEILKRLYITQDYNPVLFLEHLFYCDTLMKTCVYNLNYYLKNRFYNIAPEPQIHCALIESEIIVRIKTTGIVEREFGSGGFIISSEIQDVIKGKIIPSCKDVSIPETPDEYVRPDPYFQINEPGKCFQFVPGQYSKEIFEIGNEYIVFIDLEPLLTDSYVWCTDSLKNGYYVSMVHNPWPNFKNYIFPIKNDRVFDWASPFNFGDSLTYNEWRQKLQEKIDEILNKNYTSVEDFVPDLSDDVSVYPNPAFSDLNIFFNLDITKPVSVKLYNNLGYELQEYLLHPENKNKLRINLNNFYSGIYYLKIIDNEKIHFKKFVIVK